MFCEFILFGRMLYPTLPTPGKAFYFMDILALFTWTEEDPRRRNNFSFGFDAEISSGWSPSRKGKEEKLPAERPAAMFVFLGGRGREGGENWFVLR